MKKTIKFESEAWICDCNKIWPEDVSECICGKRPPIFKENINDRLFPYIEFVCDFPAKYEICNCCQGSGVTTFGYSEANQIAWTESEWEQEDVDFRNDYMEGKYDKPCPNCNGMRVTLIVNEDKLNDEQAKMMVAWIAQSDYYCDRIDETERRFGC